MDGWVGGVASFTELGFIQFLWRHGGSDVSVVGTFSDGKPVKMKKSLSQENTFYVDYACKQGPIEYR